MKYGYGTNVYMTKPQIEEEIYPRKVIGAVKYTDLDDGCGGVFTNTRCEITEPIREEVENG